MQYEGTVIRPPSEADAIILQVTVGCSHNKCTFCGAYRAVRFRIKSLDEIDNDLNFAQRYCKRIKKVFLADGDVLSLSMKRLEEIFLRIRSRLPWVQKISLYGNAKNIRHKSINDLRLLKNLGLSRVYMGLESGDDDVLQTVQKGVCADDMIICAQKVRSAGIFLSVTALLGLGGMAASKQHALATGQALAAMQPNQIAVLCLMVVAGTPLDDARKNGRFQLPAPQDILLELESIIRNIGTVRCQFHSNHASNYLALAGRLPSDREIFLKHIQEAQINEAMLTSESARFL